MARSVSSEDAAASGPPAGALVLRNPAAGTGGQAASAAQLLRDNIVTSHDLVQALALQAQGRSGLIDILRTRRMAAEAALIGHAAQVRRVPRIDLREGTVDPRLIDRLGAATCLQLGVLPFVQMGDTMLVLTAKPDDFARLRPALTAALGPVTMALAPAQDIENAVLQKRAPALCRAAETSVSAPESCRDFKASRMVLRLGLLLAAGLWLLHLAPAVFATLLTVWAVGTMVLVTLLKAAAGIAAHRALPAEGPAPLIARLPTVSVIVALYGESSIAPRLVARLSRLDYPRELLDIVLVVEASDHPTQRALADAELPPWMRVVRVPRGRVKTKPRALNFALDHCRGSIIGVYDAEDAPAPNQIRRIVERFHQRGPQVACLQGVLDFYNPRSNWMSRCFTMEYATWFRLMLPGLQRLGLAIPLGGTTLFFRRAVLQELGGWDAWNVTEDADLGIRLARHGYRTELIDTVTEEEACCRPMPWVKQRSRWLKGYMMTYLVHMRDPVRLWQDLGPRKFAGFQVLFFCTVSQFLLAPLLWSFWVVPFGLPHPMAALLPLGVLGGFVWLFLFSEVVNLVLGYLAMRKTRHRLSPLWLLTLQLYFPLGAVAAYKGLWEIAAKPFYWDKTTHGLFDPIPPPT